MTASTETVNRGVEVTNGRSSPYFGLDYFRQEDGPWFFGRGTESARVITNLQAVRLTLLYAASGVGKSSLLRAGIAWRLGEARKAGAVVDIPVVFAAWKDNPVAALIDAIGDAIEPLVPPGLERQLCRTHLDEAISDATKLAHANLVVILDQFEEYFLYRAKEKPVPDAFAQELANCINRPDLSANFLIAIREDAYARLGDLFKGRIANVYGNYLPMAYLTRQAAEEAIRRPVELYNDLHDTNFEIQDGLVEAVLDQIEVRHGAAQALSTPVVGRNQSEPALAGDASSRVATPLLQLVMQTIWERELKEHSRCLRLATLTELKGVEQIVDSHLLLALDQLGHSQREIAIDLLSHLIDASGGKFAASVADLAQWTGHQEAEVSSVLQKLDHDRIVTSVQAPPGRDPEQFQRYEVFHDVLAPAITRTVTRRAADRKARRARMWAALAAALLIVVSGVAVSFIYLWRTAVNDQVQLTELQDDHVVPIIANLDKPDALAVAPDGGTVYVVNQGNGTVVPFTIDIKARTGTTASRQGCLAAAGCLLDRQAPITVGELPAAITITGDGAAAYVANYGSDTVTPINLKTGAPGTAIPVGREPVAIAIAALRGGDIAYVANYGSNTVTPINLNTGKPGTAIPVGEQPVAIAIAVVHHQSIAYVANQGSGTVIPITITMKTGTPGPPIPVGQLPVAIAVTPSGTKVYVARQYDSVTPISISDDKPGTPIHIVGRPVAIAITHDGAAAYVADWASGTVTPIRLSSNSWLGALGVWLPPTHFPPGPPPPMPIAIAPNGTSAYVANYNEGIVSKLTLPIE